MDSNISVLENTNNIFNEMIEDELLQLNGGVKEAVVGWIVEQIIEKSIELIQEVVKIVSKPDNPSHGYSGGTSALGRSHSSGGRSLPLAALPGYYIY